MMTEVCMIAYNYTDIYVDILGQGGVWNGCIY